VIWKIGAVLLCLDVIAVVYCLAVGETTQALRIGAAATMLGVVLTITKGVV
jgi:hypothetical protein